MYVSIVWVSFNLNERNEHTPSHLNFSLHNPASESASVTGPYSVVAKQESWKVLLSIVFVKKMGYKFSVRYFLVEPQFANLYYISISISIHISYTFTSIHSSFIPFSTLCNTKCRGLMIQRLPTRPLILHFTH